MHLTNSLTITVGARDSKLSLIQVDELLAEVRHYYPEINFSVRGIKTTGDLDLTTPLVDLEKTDFFTKELDQILLDKEVQITVHSAKDLPEPLLKTLKIIAITKGQDPRDVLILRNEESIDSLGQTPRVGTSTRRREKAVLKLIPQAQFVQIRGPIPNRIKQLEQGDIDILISAECAITRLGMTKLNRILLEDVHAPMQGQLAILARDDNSEMEELFRCIDIRK